MSRLARAASFAIDVEDFALLTYRVPAERVRAHLPAPYELQTHVYEREECCFVSTTCFLNRDFRPAALQYPRHTFYESTYRAYVELQGRDAVYFFGRYLGSSASYAAQRAVDRHALRGDFDVSVDRDGRGYSRYVCDVASETGATSFVLDAREPTTPIEPFATGDEHGQFITFRPVGCFTSSVGVQAHAHVRHDRLRPWQGRVANARLDLWHELGIVTPDEAATPASVLVAPGTTFYLFPPLPVIASRSGTRTGPGGSPGPELEAR